MANHYFSEDANELPSNPKEIKANILGETFTFTTDNGVFSKDYLDYATALLLKNIDITKKTKTILDVGCGYGPVGIILNKIYDVNVTMIDINPRALSLAKQNVEKNKTNAEVYKSNCMDEVNGSFDMIISNPPIRAGKEVVYKIFEQSFDKLNDGGELWVVMQYNHGAPSAITKLKTIFSEVKTVYKKKGFYIIRTIK
ncbi:MAG: class I SAM-dependent methyltransferase [bacterium]